MSVAFDLRRRGCSAVVLAALFAVSGVLHFVIPGSYARIIPHALPEGWARPLVYVSGVAELVGAAALLNPRTRRFGGWWLVALLVAVFPANVQMALDDPNLATVGRLPLQAPLIWWAWTQTRPASRDRAT